METLASANHHGPALPGFLNSLAGPIDHYGIGAIALLLLLENIGVPVIPGELAMIAGAIFAGTGRAGLNVVEVGVVSVAAAIVGAEIGYLIGRFAGRELVLRYGKWVLIKPHHLDRAETIVSRYGGIVVVIARFIVGLREANGVIAGISQMRWLTFGWSNVLGACAWVATWVSVGYAAGDAIGTIYRNINRFGLYALLVLAVLLAGYIIRRVVRRRRAVSVTAESSTAAAEVPQDDSGTSDDSETSEDSETGENAETEKSPVTEEDSGVQEDLSVQEDIEIEEDNETRDDPVTRESP
jgi:membrane protein DedA with SNARE-associated domain